MYFKVAALFPLLPCAAVAAEVGWSGTLSSLDGGLGGSVKVVDNTTLMISNYKLKDASAPALYWWGSTTNDLSSGFRINNEQVTKPATTDTRTIALNSGKTAADFSVVGLWCEKLNANFGQATLAKDGNAGSAASSQSQGQKMTGAAASGKSGGDQIAATILLVTAICLAI